MDLPAVLASLRDWIVWAAQRLGDAVPLLLGGAGGVVIVWLLDGRRQKQRDRRRLQGAMQIVGLELAGNVAMADQWASLPERLQAGEDPETLDAGPVVFKASAWERNQDEMARQLPRELITRIGLGYGLITMFERNVVGAQKRGHVVENDLLLATRTRDALQAALRGVQTYGRDHLGVKFPVEPIGPSELRQEERARPAPP